MEGLVLEFAPKVRRLPRTGRLETEVVVRNVGTVARTIRVDMDAHDHPYLVRPGEKDPANFPIGGKAASLPPYPIESRTIQPGGSTSFRRVFEPWGCREPLPPGRYVAQPMLVLESAEYGLWFWYARGVEVEVTD